MTPLIKLIIDKGLADFILHNKQLARLLDGSNERRYGLINRAMKANDLVRVKRGIYVLADKYRNKQVHPFALAQQLMPGSYVSAESALSYHGWIPEAVQSVLSITAKGKSVNYEHKMLGKFEFQRMTTITGYFLHSVTRHVLQEQVALVAEPLRALLDLMYLRKMQWQGLEYLLNSLRIDETAIRSVSSVDIRNLLNVYKGKREKEFIKELLSSLDLKKSHLKHETKMM